MPMYRLWRQSDNTSFDENARDDEHALVVFGKLLGVLLTLTEGPAAPPYMMGRIESARSWTKPPDIPVYEIRQRSGYGAILISSSGDRVITSTGLHPLGETLNQGQVASGAMELKVAWEMWDKLELEYHGDIKL